MLGYWDTSESSIAPRAIFRFLFLLLTLALPFSAASADDVTDAEAMARALYFEGVPYDDARSITAAGAARLVEMLDDPAEAQHHATVIEVLALSGRTGAYEAIARYAAAEPEGEIGASSYRSRLAIPLAMGHLARQDNRALAHLTAAVARDGLPPWHYRHLDAASVGSLLRELSISGLGLSGRPEAVSTLERMRPPARPQAGRAQGVGLDAHIDDALAMHARIATRGAAAVLGKSSEGTPR